MQGHLEQGLHSFQAGFSAGFRRQFIIWLLFLPRLSTSKNPFKRGLLTFMTMSGCGGDSETHHPGHSAEIRFQIGMEGGVVVVNGAIRVFQSVACENTDHRGSRRHFVFAFEQTRH